MGARENMELAHRAWAAVAASDVDTLRKIWAADIIWHVTADNPWSGDKNGIDAVLDYLADVGEAGEAYDTRLDDVLASEDRVLLVCHVFAKRAGKVVETDTLMLARIEGDLIAEVWTAALDPKAFLDFYD